MSSKTQRLKSTITIGSVLDGSVKRNVGFLKSGLGQVGDAIKGVERRQRELSKQRRVLERQGQSVAELDREYDTLDRTLRDLRRSQERWNRAAAASRRVGATFGTMVRDVGSNARRLAIGASVAGGAIFGIAASTASLGDGVAKTADKLGIGIEALQELRYAAERSGVATGTFDSALEKMTKNIGLALEGTGAQKDALDTLGLSASSLATMSPEDALATIADRLQSVETQAERAAIANDIFGRSGIGLLIMLRDGSKGLDQLRADARKTGYVLSEEAARDAEVFQDTLLDLQLVLAGLKNTVGAELMPVVTDAMRNIGDALIDNRADVKKWSRGFAKNVETALPIIGDVLSGISSVTDAVQVSAATVADMVGGWKNFGAIIGAILVSRTVVRIGKFGKAVFDLGRSMLALARTTPVVAGGIRAVGAAMMANPIGIAVAAIAGGAYLIYKNWSGVGVWFRDRWENVKQIFGGFADFAGGVFSGNLGKAWESIKSAWSGVNAFWSGLWDGVGSIFTSVWQNVIKPVTDALGLTESIEAAWTGLKSTFQTVLGAIGGVFDRVWSTAIRPIIDGLKSIDGIGAAWENLKTVITSVLDVLAQKFKWVMGFIRPVVDGLRWVKEKGAGVLGSVGIGGGPAQNTKEKRAQAPAGVGPNRFALGGSFSPGPILVGEKGPELRYENRAGFIAHHRSLQLLGKLSDRARSASFSGASGESGKLASLFSAPPAIKEASSAARQVVQNITYTINAAGASAEEVIRIIERKSRKAAGTGLYDRVPVGGMVGR